MKPLLTQAAKRSLPSPHLLLLLSPSFVSVLCPLSYPPCLQIDGSIEKMLKTYEWATVITIIRNAKILDVDFPTTTTQPNDEDANSQQGEGEGEQGQEDGELVGVLEGVQLRISPPKNSVMGPKEEYLACSTLLLCMSLTSNSNLSSSSLCDVDVFTAVNESGLVYDGGVVVNEVTLPSPLSFLLTLILPPLSSPPSPPPSVSSSLRLLVPRPLSLFDLLRTSKQWTLVSMPLDHLVATQENIKDRSHTSSPTPPCPSLSFCLLSFSHPPPSICLCLSLSLALTESITVSSESMSPKISSLATSHSETTVGTLMKRMKSMRDIEQWQ
jgi:hypothetical protein